MTTTAPDAVARSRALVEPELRAAVARLHPRLALVAAYHRGWVEADGTPRSEPGGKALRPALALLGARAAWAEETTALPGAVTTELVHDFSLLHDDLMDGDTERRHRPTAWTVFGAGAAVLAGDGLLALATDLMLEVEGPTALPAQRALATAVRRLVAGQADDLEYETRADIGVADYLAMAAGKTSALLACACSVGAVLAGAQPAVVEGLATFGEHLGLAFQLTDDLLGLWGEPAVTGKPVLSDLRARKRSAPVVMALAGGGPGAERLRAHLAATGPTPGDELAALAAVVEELGGRQRVADELERQLRLADAALEPLPIPPDVAAELHATASYVTRRDR